MKKLLLFLLTGILLALILTVSACGPVLVTNTTPITQTTIQTMNIPLNITIKDLINSSNNYEHQELVFTGIYRGLWQNPSFIINLTDPMDENFMIGVLSNLSPGGSLPSLKYIHEGDSITIRGYINGTRSFGGYIFSSPFIGSKGIKPSVSILLIMPSDGIDNTNGYEWPHNDLNSGELKWKQN